MPPKSNTGDLDPWDAVHAKLDRIIEDVNAPPRPGHPGGLLSRQAKSETRLDELEAQRASGLSFKHGALLATVSAAISAALTRVADAVTRGVTPPGHP